MKQQNVVLLALAALLAWLLLRRSSSAAPLPSGGAFGVPFNGGGGGTGPRSAPRPVASTPSGTNNTGNLLSQLLNAIRGQGSSGGRAGPSAPHPPANGPVRPASGNPWEHPSDATRAEVNRSIIDAWDMGHLGQDLSTTSRAPEGTYYNPFNDTYTHFASGGFFDPGGTIPFQDSPFATSSDLSTDSSSTWNNDSSGYGQEYNPTDSGGSGGNWDPYGQEYNGGNSYDSGGGYYDSWDSYGGGSDYGGEFDTMGGYDYGGFDSFDLEGGGGGGNGPFSQDLVNFE